MYHQGQHFSPIGATGTLSQQWSGMDAHDQLTAFNQKMGMVNNNNHHQMSMGMNMTMPNGNPISIQNSGSIQDNFGQYAVQQGFHQARWTLPNNANGANGEYVNGDMNNNGGYGAINNNGGNNINNAFGTSGSR